MRFAAVLKLAVATLATGALLVPSIGPAKAEVSYPPHVSLLYASPFVSGGYAAVSLSGDHLTSGLTVKASRGSRYTLAKLNVHSSGTVATALVKVSSVLSTTAGQYPVTFTVLGSTVTGDTTTTTTYTVGKRVAIKSFRVLRKSYGLYISGTAAKSTPVKIAIKYGSRSYYKTVYGSRSSGYFFYRFYKTSKGTYTVTAKVAPNTRYFSDAVTTIYVRS